MCAQLSNQQSIDCLFVYLAAKAARLILPMPRALLSPQTWRLKPLESARGPSWTHWAAVEHYQPVLKVEDSWS